MNGTTLSFDKEQFGRLFPFYILVDDNQMISSCGSSAIKLFNSYEGKPFFNCFTPIYPESVEASFSSIKAITGQLAVIQSIRNPEKCLKGQFELLETTGQLLFIGSPYVNPTEQLNQHKSKQDHFVASVARGKELRAPKGNASLNEDLKQLAEENINAVIITDKEGRITWVNKSFCRLTGYSIKEVFGEKPGHLLQGPDTDKNTVAYFNKQIRAGKPFAAEIINYTKAGKSYWLKIQGQPIHDASGTLTGFFAIEEDITKEKEIKQRIEDSENLVRLALEKIGDNVWEHDFITGKTFFSKSSNDFWGYSINETSNVEQIWWDSVFKDDLHFLTDNDQKYKKGEIDSHSIEYRVVHKNGSIKWVLDRGVVIEKSPNGKPLKIIGTHTDISQIKQTETELEQKVKQFKSLSENIPGVIYEYGFNKDGTEGFIYVSPALNRIFGISPDNFLEHVHPDDRERIRQKNEHSKNTLEPFHNESRLIMPNGALRWNSMQSSYSYTDQNGTKVFTGFMTDITQRKTVEQTLSTNEEKYRSIIENMNLGLLEVDNDEIVTYANQSFCTMSGYKMEEFAGKKASTFFATGEDSHILQEKTQKRKSGISDAYEIQVRDKQGNKKWWLISGAPRYSDKGELVGSIGIHLDITEQKQLELQLIEARIRAENLAQTKEIFLANMSHEIRTPMNAIMGMTRQLAKTNLLPQQQFYLDIVHSASDNLLVILNDILDLSKIEAGKLSFENIGFEPKMVAKRVLQVLAHKAEEKGLILANSYFDPAISPILIGDPHRINQILLNLMGNSIKFTEKGRIDLLFNLLEDKPESQIIQLDVLDTGIGMDQTYLAHLFDKFSQEHESISRKYGGTGLGMSICRNLVDLMGGEIKAQSEKGIGTKMSIVIELKKGTLSDLPVKEIIQFKSDFLKGRKILITDDNELNRLVAAVILKNYGAHTIEAANGQLAIEMINKHKPDIVLMDLQMPVLSGVESTKAIRHLYKNLPVIALTAEAIKGERERCIAAGMSDYLSKPFKEEEFLKVIDKWLPKKDLVNCVEIIESETAMTNPLYNLTTLKSISRGNDFFVEKMVKIFCEDTPPIIADMKAAYQTNQLDKIAAIAHKMKPSIDNLQIAGLKSVIVEIEKMGKNQQNTPRFGELLQQTEHTIAQVIKQMNEEYPNLNDLKI
ncbi:MAG: PAS domain S-box protein [Mucilaginibacter sp.]